MEVCVVIKLRTGMNSTLKWHTWVSLACHVTYALCIREKLDLYLSIDMVDPEKGGQGSAGTWI